MFNNLLKKKLIKNIFFQQVREFKREIVSTDFKIKHNENSFKKQKNKLNLLKNMKETQGKELKQNYDVESIIWCSSNKFNDRKD